jgi:hypothetical protein
MEKPRVVRGVSPPILVAFLFSWNCSSAQRTALPSEVAFAASEVVNARTAILEQVDEPNEPSAAQYRVIRRWTLTDNLAAQARRLFGTASNFTSDDPTLRTKLAFVAMFVLQFDRTKVTIGPCSMWMVFEGSRGVSEVVAARTEFRKPIASLIAENAADAECLAFHLGHRTSRR